MQQECRKQELRHQESATQHRSALDRAAFAVLVILSISLPAFADSGLQRRVDDNGVIYYRQISDATALEALAKGVQSAPLQTPARKPSSSRSKLTAAQRAAKEQAKQAQRQEKHCARLQARLDRVQYRLDAGYQEPQGNALRHQRRELRSRLFRECR